jgi:uncharacterized membrane protein YkvA (DUF1232 family)
MISGQQSASWWDAEALIRRLAADEEEVRRGFWRKLRQLVSQLPFAEDLVTAHYCAFDRQTPGHVKAALIGALAYFVLPTDAVPDVLPLIGYTDDAAVLGRLPVRHLPHHARPPRGGATHARAHA